MRRLLELESLSEKVGTEPAFRWGARAPAEVLNLAYAQAPGLTSASALLVFDRSGHLTANATPSSVTEKTMQVASRRVGSNTYYVLQEVGGQQSTALPAKDWYVTNAFLPVVRGGVTAYIPLYFRATARFLHYEVNPPVLPDAEADRYGAFQSLVVYQGRHIQLWEHGEPASVSHVVALRAVTGYTELWFVDVYFPYLQDIFERRLVLSYYKARVKTSGSGYDRYPQHYETLSPQPYFTEHVPTNPDGSPNYDRWGELGSQDPRFVVHPTATLGSYEIEVGQQTQNIST